MHSVYQAQYPKLFTYIADTYYLWTHMGNKRVLQLIITKTMYRKLLPLVTKEASKLCVYSVCCWLHWVISVILFTTHIQTIVFVVCCTGSSLVPRPLLFFVLHFQYKTQKWKNTEKQDHFLLCLIILLPCIILDRTSEAYYTGHNEWGLGTGLTWVISVVLFTTHIQTQVLEKFH